LAAELHIELKNYSEGLICLNHASKIAGKSAKQASKNIEIETVYA
jgi:predicted HTH domain antitoxin